MAKALPKEISNELYKALSKLEVGTDIIKALWDYLDIPDVELTESERYLKKRAGEFLGRK